MDQVHKQVEFKLDSACNWQYDAENTVLGKLFHASTILLTSILHVCLASLKLLPRLTLEPGATKSTTAH